MSNKEKCFEYFNSNKGQEKGSLLKGVVSKFGITRLTAENYYSKWEDEKDVEEAVENIFGKDEINELCENTKFEKETAAVDDKPAKPADKPAKLDGSQVSDSEVKKKSRLKIKELEGEKFNYAISEEVVMISRSTSNSGIPVNKGELEGLILELVELKEVVM